MKSTNDPDIDWLKAAPERSASILARLEAEPDPPTPPSGDDMIDNVTNETELRDALQTYADERRVGMMYSKTGVTLTQTITIQQPNHDGSAWGANGNHTKVNWAGAAGEDMIVYKGINGVANRMLFLEKFSLYGGGYASAAAGACLKIWAPDGDNGSIYKFTLRDIFTSYANYGVVLSGAVFEGMCENIHGENHLKDGMMMQHERVGEANQAIVSNIAVIHPNLSRNLGAGMRQVYSCNSIMGSYILNGAGGIAAPEGLRAAILSNGENTGECLFDMASNGYGSTNFMNEASSDGSTVCRQYVNGVWVDVGKPLLYGMTQPGGVQEGNNHTSYYGSAGIDPMRWVK